MKYLGKIFQVELLLVMMAGFKLAEGSVRKSHSFLLVSWPLPLCKMRKYQLKSGHMEEEVS